MRASFSSGFLQLPDVLDAVDSGPHLYLVGCPDVVESDCFEFRLIFLCFVSSVFFSPKQTIVIQNRLCSPVNERSFRDLYQLFPPFLPAQSTVGEREIFSFSISKKTSHKNENLARIKRIYRSLVLVVFNLFTSLRFEIGHCPSRPGSRQGKHFFFFFFSMLPFTCHTVTNSIDSLSLSLLSTEKSKD